MQQPDGMLPKRTGSHAVAALWIIVYAIIVLTPMTLAYLSEARTDESYLHELGKMFALTAVPILILQMVLASRLRPISRHYGFDMVMRFHKGMAALALVLLVCHPFLIAGGTGRWQLVTGLAAPWKIWLGRLTLLLLFSQAVTSLLQRRLLNFQKWRFIHNQAIFIWLFGWTHSFTIGDDLELLPLRVLWVIAALGVFGFYLYHKVYIPSVTRRHAWEVVDIKQETHDVWTLTFKPPPEIAHFAYWPGQFRFVTLLRPGRPFDGEEHHFTISSSPTTPGVHTSTIKESGDFTRTVWQTKPGDQACIQGAYGRFSHVVYPEERDLVFIAGGIGITPLMSMLRYMRDTQADLDVLLLYGNKNSGDIVFRDELAQMEAGERPRLRVVHVLSEPDRGWSGETGFVDREKIERHCGGITGKSFYLCGPPKMMEMLEVATRDLGVPVDHIHSERFSL